MTQKFKAGTLAIYRKKKYSIRPGPRAEDVHPAPYGEDYSYHVDKFWIVDAVKPDGKILARTRRGKQRILDSDDPSLRKATWWERLLWKRRFPLIDAPSSDAMRSTASIRS
jgi:hypothetical protein